MKKLFVAVCEDIKTEYMCVSNTTLYFSPLYEHVYRKIQNAIEHLSIRDIELVKCATYDIPNISSEIDADIEDIIIFAHPLSFLCDGEDVERALSYVMSTELGYATVGSMLSLLMTVGTGAMLSDATISSPYDFISVIGNCGAACEHKAFGEGSVVPTTKAQYLRLCEKYRQEFFDYLVDFGVNIDLRDSIIISPESKILAGARLLPSSQICADSRIGSGCIIGPSSVVVGSFIGDDTIIDSSQIYHSVIEKDVKIGPFCHVCDGAHILSDTEVYSYAEVRNSTVGPMATVREHSLLADCEVGARVIIGSGFTVATYDGRKNTHSKIYDDAFIGAGVTLVSPVNVGLGAYIAAGSTITDDVPAGALAIARDYQSNHDGWARRRKKH